MPNNAPTTTTPTASITCPVNGAAPVTMVATDLDHDTITYYLAQPKFGRVEPFGSAESGDVIYRPNRGYSGPDAFSIMAADGKGGQATMRVTVSVGGSVAAPVAPALPDTIMVGSAAYDRRK